jgi:hypothetical protein
MIGTQLFAVVHDNTHLNLALYTRNIKASLHKMIQEPLSALFSLHPSQAKPSQRQTPISVATMGPSSTNRIFGTRRTVVVLVLVVLSLVTYSLVSISYSSMVAYVPNFSSQKNQTNKVIMAAATKQPNAEIIALSSPSAPQSIFVEVVGLPAVEEHPSVKINGAVESINPRLAATTTTTEAEPIVPRPPVAAMSDHVRSKVKTKTETTSDDTVYFVLTAALPSSVVASNLSPSAKRCGQYARGSMKPPS